MKKTALIVSLIAQVVVILGAAFIAWGIPVSDWGVRIRVVFVACYASAAIGAYVATLDLMDDGNKKM